MLDRLQERIQGKCHRTVAALAFRRRVPMRNNDPIVSFTFDDFPQSALAVGGRILLDHGATGTYYVSLGLLEQESAVGRICSAADLHVAVAEGHELGCHTFAHCDPWATDFDQFRRSVLHNQAAVNDILPGTRFKTMSYALSSTPRPRTKRWVGTRFSGCRTGGQRSNYGTVDLNYVQSFFLEQSRDDPTAVWELIERNSESRGWLVFSTHDVIEQPTRYGCTPKFFREVVRRSIAAGATLLTMAAALRGVCGPDQSSVEAGQDGRVRS